MSLFRPLREVITFRGGGTPSRAVTEYWDGSIPWATVKDFTSTKISSTQESITEAGLHNSSANLIPRGHVIIPTRMSLGKAAINEIDLAINQDLRALIPKESLDACYLLHAVLSLRDAIVRKGSGATVKGITQDELYGLEVFFPPLEDQVRIAHLLGKVEGLITQRKQQLQRIDDLLKSMFLEMFGDPIKNPRQFSVRRLSEFYLNPKEGTKCGPFGSALKKDELVDSGVPVWNIDNIGPDGQMMLPFRMWITREKYKELAVYSVQDGDILISRAGTVGKMCIAEMNDQPAIISTNLIRLRLGSDLRPLHFVSLMLYCKGRVGRLKVGADGAFTHMNTGILDSLEFPYPPIELQDRFGEIASQVRAIKFRYQKSLSDLEALYGALSQKAFKGELDLSRVPMPNAESPETQAAVPDVAPSPADLPNVIHLPDTELLRAALKDRTHLNALLTFWLDTYRTQLNGAAFSAQAFFADALACITELHPDNDVELGIDAYELIRTWVFDALTDGRLTQGYADAENRVTLENQSPDWGTW